MGCNGPDGTRYSTALQDCVGSAYLTSCNASASESCFYGFVDLPPEDGGNKAVGAPSYFIGRISVNPQTGVAGFQIIAPGPLKARRIQSGDFVELGCEISFDGVGQHLVGSKERPATSVEVTFSKTGIDLCLGFQ